MDELSAWADYAIEKRRRLEYIINGEQSSICQHCYAEECPDTHEEVRTQSGIVVECARFIPYEGRQ